MVYKGVGVELGFEIEVFEDFSLGIFVKSDFDQKWISDR